MSKNRKELYKQIYRIIYVANINRLIDETLYINMLQKLSMEGFKTYHINDFDKLTLHLQSIGLIDSFNVSILIYLRDMNYKRMSDIAILFADIGKIFSVKKKRMVDRMNKIRKLLKDKLEVIKSFKKFERITIFSNFIDNIDNVRFVDNMINDNSFSQNKKKRMPVKRIKNEWIYYTCTDLIDRLHFIAQNHFTLNQLKYMEVELKHIREIKAMNHTNLEKYYIYVIDTIEKNLREWMMVCRMYIDIEINYVECCDNLLNGVETRLNLKHFSINIRNIQ